MGNGVLLVVLLKCEDGRQALKGLPDSQPVDVLQRPAGPTTKLQYRGSNGPRQAIVSTPEVIGRTSGS